MTRNKKRADKAAKHLRHYRDFNSNKKKPNRVKLLPQVCNINKAKKSLDDLTDYEVEQIWAEAMHYFKTEGFDPEESEKEIQELLEQDPLIKGLYQRLNRLVDSKSTRQDAEPVKAHTL